MSEAPRLSVTADAPAPRRWGMFAAGMSVWAAAWAADVGVTYGMGHENPGWSLIPVVGPFIQLGDSYRLADPNAVKTGNASIDAQSSAMINQGNQAYQTLVYTGLVLDAALQIAGVATAIAGAVMHTRPGRARFSAAGRLAITF